MPMGKSIVLISRIIIGIVNNINIFYIYEWKPMHDINIWRSSMLEEVDTFFIY